MESGHTRLYATLICDFWSSNPDDSEGIRLLERDALYSDKDKVKGKAFIVAPCI